MGNVFNSIAVPYCSKMGNLATESSGRNHEGDVERHMNEETHLEPQRDRCSAIEKHRVVSPFQVRVFFVQRIWDINTLLAVRSEDNDRIQCPLLISTTGYILLLGDNQTTNFCYVPVGFIYRRGHPRMGLSQVRPGAIVGMVRVGVVKILVSSVRIQGMNVRIRSERRG
jgi:hypothetical protein